MCGKVSEPPTYNAAAGCTPFTGGNIVTANTDMGHGSDVKTIANAQAVLDFAYRAQHVVAVVTKKVIQEFYGQAPAYSYFAGCSDGGREALMEAQRYPDDFDGIIAGSTGIMSAVVQNSYHHGYRALINYVDPQDGRTARLTTADMPYLHEKVLAACDAIDGLKDGLLNDPRQCDFDTATLVCANNGNEPGCLSAEQADVVTRIHDGGKTIDGERTEPAIATQWGSEWNWSQLLPTPEQKAEGKFPAAKRRVEDWMRYIGWANKYSPEWRWTDLEFTRAGFESATASSSYMAATNPDLRKFYFAGKKLIIWHGWSDVDTSVQVTLSYWQNMAKAVPSQGEFARLYLLPGVGHCANQGNNEGAASFDMITPMMAWVENGKAPDEVIASGVAPLDNVPMQRPVYPFPAMAKWDGVSDWHKAASFTKSTPEAAPVADFTWLGSSILSDEFKQAICKVEGSKLVCSSS